MTPNRISIVTLGVKDLAKATAFYEQVFGEKKDPAHDGISFFKLRGSWVALYPLEKLAEDIGIPSTTQRGPFSGITLAHNTKKKQDVLAIFDRVKAAGATIVKPPQDAFWGGFSGYFADLDGYYWEVAWGPDFSFDPDGTLK